MYLNFMVTAIKNLLLNGQFYFMDIPEILDEKDWAANLNFNSLRNFYYDQKARARKAPW